MTVQYRDSHDFCSLLKIDLTFLLARTAWPEHLPLSSSRQTSRTSLFWWLPFTCQSWQRWLHNDFQTRPWYLWQHQNPKRFSGAINSAYSYGRNALSESVLFCLMTYGYRKMRFYAELQNHYSFCRMAEMIVLPCPDSWEIYGMVFQPDLLCVVFTRQY